MTATYASSTAKSRRTSQAPTLTDLVGRVCHCYASSAGRPAAALQRIVDENGKHPDAVYLRRLVEVLNGTLSQQPVKEEEIPEWKKAELERTEAVQRDTVVRLARKGRPMMLGHIASTLKHGGNYKLLQTCMAVMADQQMLLEPKN